MIAAIHSPTSSLTCDGKVPPLASISKGFAVVHVEELLTMLSQHRVDAAGAEIAPTHPRGDDGNPFFVTEMMHHLIESGVVVEADGRWRVDVPLERIGLPEGVRDVVSRRLSALPAGCDDVLEVIAVVGHEADLALVIDVAGLDEDLVVDSDRRRGSLRSPHRGAGTRSCGFLPRHRA